MGDNSQAPASGQYECWKKYPNSFSEPTHEDWLRELASLRAEKERAERERDEAVSKMQRGWLEVTESGINHYKQRAERAEAELAEAIRMRDRHAEASKAQNEDITALMAERDAALKDAERWDMFCTLWAASTEMRITQDDDGGWSIFQVEDVEGVVFKKLTGETPDAAIDAARKDQQ